MVTKAITAPATHSPAAIRSAVANPGPNPTPCLGGGDAGQPGQHGHRQQPGEAGDGVVHAGRDARLVRAHRRQHGGGERRHERGDAEAEHDGAGQHGVDVAAARLDAGVQQQAGGDGAATRPSWGAGARCAAPARRNGPTAKAAMTVTGSIDGAGGERRVAEAGLELHGDEERGHTEPGVHGER